MKKQSKPAKPIDPEKIIRQILAIEAPDGGKVGIYGTEVCQICGQFGSFSGWVGAMGSHLGSHNFVCIACREKTKTKAWWEDREKTSRILRKQSFRYCEICAEKISHSKKNLHGESYPVWLCPACLKCLRRLGQGKRVREFVSDLTRHRYIEKHYTTPRQLEEFRAEILADKLELEDMCAGTPAKRKRLERTRKKPA